jgi:hypothetical protein
MCLTLRSPAPQRVPDGAAIEETAQPPLSLVHCYEFTMPATGNDLLEALTLTVLEVSEDPSLNPIAVFTELVDGIEALSTVY